VAIREAQQHGVVADRLDRVDVHVALAADEHALSRPVPLHFRARRMDAQVFRRQPEALAVIERDLEHM